jgi:hypothetical protein
LEVASKPEGFDQCRDIAKTVEKVKATKFEDSRILDRISFREGMVLVEHHAVFTPLENTAIRYPVSKVWVHLQKDVVAAIRHPVSKVLGDLRRDVVAAIRYTVSKVWGDLRRDDDDDDEFAERGSELGPEDDDATQADAIFGKRQEKQFVWHRLKSNAGAYHLEVGWVPTAPEAEPFLYLQNTGGRIRIVPGPERNLSFRVQHSFSPSLSDQGVEIEPSTRFAVFTARELIYEEIWRRQGAATNQGTVGVDAEMCNERYGRFEQKQELEMSGIAEKIERTENPADQRVLTEQRDHYLELQAVVAGVIKRLSNDGWAIEESELAHQLFRLRQIEEHVDSRIKNVEGKLVDNLID